MDDPIQTNPYKTLNVPKDATLATIRSAHRKLVLACHPDKVQDPAEKLIKAEQFHEVQKAYETLSDERKRQRYDEGVKLAELRAEMMNERSAPRKTDDYYGSRDKVSPTYDTFNGVRYEIRVPPSSKNTYERDPFCAEYAEGRPSSRKFDTERYVPTSRKSSGRAPEENRKAREFETERERVSRMKEDKKETYARESKSRTKDRRRDFEAKSSRKNAYVIDEDSDSEIEDRRYKSKREAPPKQRYEDVRTRSGDDTRKSSKRENREYEDPELEWKTSAAHNHISKSREAVEIEPHPRRPTHNRAPSKLETTRTPPPPPPPSTADPGRRSSGRGRGGSRVPSPVRSSKKDRRTPEIVDSPSSRKGSIPSSSLGLKGLKNIISSSSSRNGPQRSATYQQTTDFRPKPLQRSETMPVDRMHRGEPKPLQSSNLKNMKAPSDYSDSTSDSDSEMTEDVPPIRPSPHLKHTSYRYTENENHYVLEPEEMPPRRSDELPSSRRASDRPAMSPKISTARPPPTGRSMSHAYAPEERSPHQSYFRTESSRATPSKTQSSAHPRPKLYREYSPPKEESPKMKPSPRIYDDEVRYARRGSEEPDRDAWPGSFKRRPTMGRNETVY